MRSLLVLLVPCALMAALPPEIHVHEGALKGITEDGVQLFRGVPFAAPPVGALRWHAPEPPAAWKGVRSAAAFSPHCIQTILNAHDPWTAEFMAHGAVSEDCLYLNVWTAAKSAGDKLPVLVWIHGGGFNEGSGAIAAYDGTELAKKGLIVVTVNYRMGVLGFLAHPELTKESGHNSSGNYGLLDQLAALRWVKANIAAFGGDTARITVAGQSAGAISVHALAASPLAKGLFTQMIAESGTRANNSWRPLKEAEADGVKFAASKGASSIADLRKMSAEEVRTGARGMGVVADGWLLPESAAAEADMPALAGMVWDEGSASASYLSSDMDSARKQTLQTIFNWAETRSQTGSSKTFTYVFDHPEPGPNSAKFRVFHTSEVPYVFDALAKCDRPWTAEDKRVAAMMSAYWRNFAATGDPNGPGLPVWPAFRSGTKATMQLGDKNAVLNW